MPTTYYAAVGSGDSWVGATLHEDRDCTGEHLTPLSSWTIDASECELCGECTPFGDDSADDSETCDVVKSDGDVCGRDRPCPYHDD